MSLKGTNLIASCATQRVAPEVTPTLKGSNKIVLECVPYRDISSEGHFPSGVTAGAINFVPFRDFIRMI